MIVDEAGMSDARSQTWPSTASLTSAATEVRLADGTTTSIDGLSMTDAGFAFRRPATPTTCLAERAANCCCLVILSRNSAS